MQRLPTFGSLILVEDSFLFFHFYLLLEMDNFIHSKACSTITVFPCSRASFEHPTVGEGEGLAELDTVGKRSLFITGGEGWGCLEDFGCVTITLPDPLLRLFSILMIPLHW